MEIIPAEVSNGAVRSEFQTIKQLPVNRGTQKKERNSLIYEPESSAKRGWKNEHPLYLSVNSI